MPSSQTNSNASSSALVSALPPAPPAVSVLETPDELLDGTLSVTPQTRSFSGLFDYTTIIAKGRPAPEPLADGETFTGPHLHANGSWFLDCKGGREGRRQVGCRTNDYAEAEDFADRFLSGKPTVRAADVVIGPILRFIQGHPITSDPDRSIISSMLPYWEKRTVEEITPARCRKFCGWAKKRNENLKDGTLRMRLSKLFSWLRKYLKRIDPRHKFEGYLPPKSKARERWLRRHEAARFLWAVRGRIWDRGKRAWLVDESGRRILRPPATLAIRRMLYRLIMLGLYTASRPGAVIDARWKRGLGAGYVAFDVRRFYRQAAGPRRTRKKRPPVRLIAKLFSLLECWERQDRANGDWVASAEERVIHDGKGGGLDHNALQPAWHALRRDAGLDNKVTPHTLRHTAATWLCEAGAPDSELVLFLGVSLEVLYATYIKVETAFAQPALAAFDAAMGHARYRRAAALEVTERMAAAATQAAEQAAGARRQAESGDAELARKQAVAAEKAATLATKCAATARAAAQTVKAVQVIATAAAAAEEAAAYAVAHATAAFRAAIAKVTAGFEPAAAC